MRRRVAIKILKPGMDSRAVLARFEAERQTLALMDHPGIAKVYDAGVTDTGRSYFVMERVFGESITEACDRLPLRARLTLFVAACRAIQHAHTKGVIHRDLKPSNILVTNVDGAPHPKVIDFGIAKATTASLAGGGGSGDDGAPRTLQGEILGTPEYMSPEQAVSRGVDVDTRSDVYSLGVVLFRILTARVPFPSERLRGGDFATMQRILLEEEPPKPSDVVTPPQSSAARGAATASTSRPITPRELRGDLDWIVLRALEKDRGRRYASAAALADDIERHLRNEPVLTGAPTTMYRLGKLVRRHRALVGSGVAVALALVVGIAATSMQAVRATRAEERARREAEVAMAVNEFLGRMLSAGDPTEEALGATFRGLGAYDAAHAQLARADSIRSLGGVPTREWIETKLERAQLDALKGRESAAESLLAALEPALEPFGRADPTLRARYLSMRGGALANLGRVPESDSLFMEVLAIRRAVAAESNDDPAQDGPLADALQELAAIRGKQGRLEEAEALAREALKVAIRTRPNATHFDVASAQVRLASVLGTKGSYAEADSLLVVAIGIGEAVIGPEHPLIAEWLSNRGQMRTELGALQEAEADIRRGLDIFGRARLAETARGATLLGELANILQLRGALDEALALRLRALAIQEAAVPDGREELATLWNNVGSTYRLMKRYSEAERAFVAALDGFRAAPGGNRAKIYVALHNLGKTRLDQGLAVQAEETLREAAEMGPNVLPDGHPNRAIFATTYGRALAAVGRTDEARRWLTEAHDDLTAALGAGHARTIEAAEALARLD